MAITNPTAQQQGMKRAYSMDQWRRDFASAFAAAVPMESAPTQARGPLLAADNDEPERYEVRSLSPAYWYVCDTVIAAKLKCRGRVGNAHASEAAARAALAKVLA